MAGLSKDDTRKVAKLAKLTLSSAEIDRFTAQLSKVVDLISELNEVDTKNTEPTSQTTGLTNVLRNDEIKPENCLSQEEALGGTDKSVNGFFTVAQILKKHD